MAKIKPLKQNLLFRHFTDRDIAAFAQAVEEIQMPAGQSLNFPSQGLFILSKGSIRAACASSATMPAAYADIYQEGDFWGELSVIKGAEDGQVPAPLAEMTTLESTEVLFLSSESFSDLLLNDTPIALKFLENLFGHLRRRVVELAPTLQKLLATPHSK